MIGSISLGNDEPLSLGQIAGATLPGGIAPVLLWLLLIELASTDQTIAIVSFQSAKGKTANDDLRRQLIEKLVHRPARFSDEK